MDYSTQKFEQLIDRHKHGCVYFNSFTFFLVSLQAFIFLSTSNVEKSNAAKCTGADLESCLPELEAQVAVLSLYGHSPCAPPGLELCLPVMISSRGPIS